WYWHKPGPNAGAIGEGDSPCTLGAAWCGGVSVVDSLRQHRKPFACARGLETEGDCGTRCSGGESLARLAPVPDRKRDAFARGRRTWAAACPMGHLCTDSFGAGQYSSAK